MWLAGAPGRSLGTRLQSARGNFMSRGIWSTREEALRAQTVLSWNLCCQPRRAPWTPPPQPSSLLLCQREQGSLTHLGQSLQTRPWGLPGTCSKEVD